MAYQASYEIASDNSAIDRKVESDDTEIIAVERGFLICIKRAFFKLTNNDIVHIDTRSVVEILNGRSSFLCWKEIEDFRKAQKKRYPGRI